MSLSGAAAASCSRATWYCCSTSGLGAGSSIRAKSQLRTTGYGGSSAGHSHSCGHVEVNNGSDCGHCVSSCGRAATRNGSATTFPSALGTFNTGSSENATMDLDADKDDSDYDNNPLLEGRDEDNNIGTALWEANALPEGENLSQVRLLCGAISTNSDYGIPTMTRRLDTHSEALAFYKTVELQALIFFASRLSLCTMRFPEGDLHICFRCNQWHRIAPTLRCNCNG
jgi:hypothetical protein